MKVLKWSIQLLQSDITITHPTLSFRPFKDKLVSQACLKCPLSLWSSAWRWLTSFDRVAGICAQQNRLIVFPSATFTVQNPETKWWKERKKNKRCNCVLNALWNHEKEIIFLVHVEHFSSPGFQSSSITRGVLRGNECRQAVIQRHRV